MKNKSRECNKKQGSKLRHPSLVEDARHMSTFAGSHTKTHIDSKIFGQGLLKSQTRNTKEKEGKYGELRRLLQKSSLISEGDDKIQPAPKSKLFSLLAGGKLSSATQHSNLDKTYKARSGSKEILNKVKQLFATKSTEKNKTKLRRSKDKRPAGRSIDETLMRHSRGISILKSREASKGSKGSPNSRKVTPERTDISIRKLTRFYEKLSAAVDSEQSTHDEKIKTISKLFNEYSQIIHKLDDGRTVPISQQESDLRHKILSFFTFYSKMNAKAYVYTRKLVSDSLNHLEKFIVKERESLIQFTPQYFATLESVDLKEAVSLLVDFAEAMVEQNKILANYIKKNIGKQDTEELFLRKKKPAIIKSLLPGNRRSSSDDQEHTDSSMSNMEKENDLNQLYDYSSYYKPEDEYEVHLEAKRAIRAQDRQATDQEDSKPLEINKLGLYGDVPINPNDDYEYEYSETSKKKGTGLFDRKLSRSNEPNSKDSLVCPKRSKPIYNKSTKDTWPKKSLDHRSKEEEGSNSHLKQERKEGQRQKQIPAVDLRLKLSNL